jgi:hypothetical protein
MKEVNMCINDRFQIKDECLVELNGDIFNIADDKHCLKVGGSVTANVLHETNVDGQIVNIMGETIFEDDHNDIIITGSTFLLEQAFKLRSSFTMTTLSADLNVNASILPDGSNVGQEYIFGFMVGTGGSGSVKGDIIAVNYTDKDLTQLVPFRTVPTVSDLSDADKAKYAMKKQVGNYYQYYTKKFEITPVIKHLFIDGTEIPPNVNETGASKGIRIFTEMICDINSRDLREYFNVTSGNIDRCRVNTLGIVAGIPTAGGEFACVRMIAKINFNDFMLRDLESGLRFTYKMYCV